jgi:acylphosphatase
MPVLQATVLGRVQGVGFRWFVRCEARALGLAGRVANGSDGSVQVTAEGDRAGLEALLLALRAGPQGSRVTSVEHVFADGPLGLSGFHIEAGEVR